MSGLPFKIISHIHLINLDTLTYLACSFALYYTAERSLLFVCVPEVAAAAAAAAEASLPSPRQSIHRDSAGAK